MRKTWKTCMRAFLPALLFVVALIGAVATASAQEKDPRIETRRLLSALADGKSENGPWEVSNRIIALIEQPEIRPHILKILDESLNSKSTPVRLASAKTILQLAEGRIADDSREYKAGMALLRLAAGEEIPEPFRLQAAELLKFYKELGGNRKLVKKLRRESLGCKNEKVKVILSEALYRYSLDTMSRRTLALVFNRSSDRDIRSLAALALFEISMYQGGAGTVLPGFSPESGKVRALVSEISSEPTPQGARARMLLKQYDLLKQASLGRNLPVILEPDKDGYSFNNGVSMLLEILQLIQRFYPDQDKVIMKDFFDRAATGMTGQLDRFSEYLGKEDVRAFNRDMTGNYYGIGVYVVMEEDKFKVLAPIYGTPADRAGLQSGDWITGVDGVKTQGLKMNEIILRLKGPENTPVRVKFYRRGFPEEKEVTIIRARITVPLVKTQKLPGEIGYIRLTKFGYDSFQAVNKVLKQLETDGAKGIILDLRDNGGGLLNDAVRIADLFLPEGKLIVYDMGLPEIKPRENFYSSKGHTNLPLVILINHGSASASEIVSGCMKEHKRALLIGQKSYGKGTVQRVFPLQSSKLSPDESDNEAAQLKLTVAKYYLPSGQCIHEKGIEPDIKQEARKWKMWQYEEINNLEKTDAIRNYAIDNFKNNIELFSELAMYDAGDCSRYPGFEEFYKGLDTKLARDDVRFLVRDEIRRQLAGHIHKELAADYQEDIVLRRGILELAKQIGLDLSKIVPYAGIREEFASKAEEEKQTADTANVNPGENAKEPGAEENGATGKAEKDSVPEAGNAVDKPGKGLEPEKAPAKH